MKTKWVSRVFGYTQCDELAAYLQTMAKKGWQFRRFRFGLLFDRCVPTDDEYDVQVFLKNEENDLAPNEDTLDFASYCEAAGWELVDSRNRFVVFRKTREDAVPILTPEERLDSVYRAQRDLVRFRHVAAIFYLFYLLMVLSGVNIFFQQSLGFLLEPPFFPCLLLFLVLLFDVVSGTLHLRNWYGKKKKELERTGQVVCEDTWDRFRNWGMGCTYIVILLWMILVFMRFHPVPGFWLTKDWLFSWFPFLLIWGVTFFNQWGRPSRETRHRRIVLTVVLILAAGWLIPMILSVYGK